MHEFQFEVGLVLSERIVDPKNNTYEYLIECPDKNIQKFYIAGNQIDVGQKVRMEKNEDEEENGYKLLGIL